MKKRYYLLSFVCINIECDTRTRLDNLEFDFMGRGHCPSCRGKNFEVYKRKVTNVKLVKEKNYRIAMVETKKQIK